MAWDAARRPRVVVDVAWVQALTTGLAPAAVWEDPGVDVSANLARAPAMMAGPWWLAMLAGTRGW